MNRITITGNIGREPELKYSQSGMAILKFSLADNYGRDEKKVTIWHNVTAFNDLAENAAASIGKGGRVTVEGRLTEDNYVNKEGVEVRRYSVLADDIALSLRFGGAEIDPMPVRKQAKTEEEPF